MEIRQLGVQELTRRRQHIVILPREHGNVMLHQATGSTVHTSAMPIQHTSSTREVVVLGKDRPDRLLSARSEHPSKVRLVFADGLSGEWSFDQLDLDMSNMKPATVKSAASGTALVVESKLGDKVTVDSSSLRATVDPAFAAELEKALLKIRGPLDDMIVTAPRGGQ